jgi:rhamnose utilization protein RhaD (predicted bifunctional aldolase and dehydrogenase)
LLVRDRGVLVDAASGTGAEDVLTCLGLVAARLEPSARVSYLSPSAVSELISWDAEKYRQLLDNTSK